MQTTDVPESALGVYVYRARRRLGISPEDLSIKMGFSLGYISKLKRGQWLSLKKYDHSLIALILPLYGVLLYSSLFSSHDSEEVMEVRI